MNNFLTSIQLIDGTLIAATTPLKSGPGSDGNERVFHTSQRQSDAI